MIGKNDIVLVGKPNSGKSSLFNQLTGLNQKVGNFSGVTVELKYGKAGDTNIIDLPGLKSLRTTSPEEKISKNAILELSQTNNIIFIASGIQLEDSLMLFSEIADLQIPMILVINFKDQLEDKKIKIDLKGIEEQCGCPVVCVNSRSGDGVDELEDLLKNNSFKVPNSFCKSAYDHFENGEYNNSYKEELASETADHSSITEQSEYSKRQKIVSAIAARSIPTANIDVFLARTKKWDNILLHPVYGMIIFLFIMYVVFQAVFTFSTYPMDWIDNGIAQISEWSNLILPQGWFQSFITNALIPGIGGVLIFIPQIAILFFLLGILEQVGYLSRISYISDAFLRKFGLSGKSVIPLMSSWACSIPAIMSARVIDDPKERFAVILASPLMTCSARLPVYTILISVVFPPTPGSIIGIQGLVLLSLYLLGVFATLFVAYIINKYSTAESNPFWSLELPIYRSPNWKNIGITVYNKTKSFVVGAGKVILAISIVLWVLSTNSPKSDTYIDQRYSQFQEEHFSQASISEESFKLEYSYMGYMGKFIEPVIAPLGYDWKIGVALLSSFAAREVFVGTLSTLYSIGSDEESTIVQRLKNEKVFGTNEPRFGLATSISLLLFYVFALQCMSTVAIVRKETGKWRYAIIQFAFMLFLAYGFAFAANQLIRMLV